MSAIAVAGGLGDLGRLIVDALYETGKYEVYIMSRKVRFSIISCQCYTTQTIPNTYDLFRVDAKGICDSHVTVDRKVISSSHPERLQIRDRSRRAPGKA
ncbi:hypothetical protein AUP68_09982 [Ilyonectria robusta]